MTTQQKQEVTKQELKDLIDGLPDYELHAVKRFIQYVRDVDDPVLRSLMEAPWDDEPVTEEDIAAIAESDEDFRTGNVFTQEEIEKELQVRHRSQAYR